MQRTESSKSIYERFLTGLSQAYPPNYARAEGGADVPQSLVLSWTLVRMKNGLFPKRRHTLFRVWNKRRRKGRQLGARLPDALALSHRVFPPRIIIHKFIFLFLIFLFSIVGMICCGNR